MKQESPSAQRLTKAKRSRWWLAVKLILAFVAILATARLVLGWYAEHQLQARLDSIAACGESLQWRDLARPPVPDDQNAALAYKRAADALPFPADCASPPHEQAHANTLFADLDHAVADDQYRQTHPREVSAALDATAKSLRLARDARRLSSADWGIDFQFPGPLHEVPVPNLAQYQLLARVLYLAAMDAHGNGDDAEAIQCVLDILALATAVGDMPFFYAFDRAAAISSMACAAVERLAPQLNIGSRAAASRQQVQCLIAGLLDDEADGKAFVRAARGERCIAHDLFGRLRSGGQVSPHVATQTPWLARVGLLQPICDLDDARVLDLHTMMINSPPSDFPAGMAMIEPHGRPWLPGFIIDEHTDGLSPDDYRHILRTRFKGMALRRMAATALAMRMYQLDSGNLPADLGQLAPRYLPAIPLDPFCRVYDSSGPEGMARQGPIGYKATPSPLLYCVGEDGRDDGGTHTLKDGRVQDFLSPDMVHFLDRDHVRNSSATPPRVRALEKM